MKQKPELEAGNRGDGKEPNEFFLIVPERVVELLRPRQCIVVGRMIVAVEDSIDVLVFPAFIEQCLCVVDNLSRLGSPCVHDAHMHRRNAVDFANFL